MKYSIVRTKRFKIAYKKVKRLKSFKIESFEHVMNTLASGNRLSKKYKDHKLTGNLKDFRECHIAPDILLLYQIDDGVLTLTLVSLGSHSKLFK